MTRTNCLRPACATALPLVLAAFLTASSARRAQADDVPVVEVTAKRFAFSPDKITLKKGQTVKIRLHSEDVTHGFFLRSLKLDEEIPLSRSSPPRRAGILRRSHCGGPARFCWLQRAHPGQS